MKYQVAIIGGGPAGYTAAETAGKAGLSVVLLKAESWRGVSERRVYSYKDFIVLCKNV